MRDTILREAVELFATRGYAGSSMRELARRCGTPVSNVYNYVPSKQALLQAVFHEATEQIRRTIAAGRGEGEGGDLEAYLASVLHTVRENLQLWRLIHQLRHDEEVQRLLDEEFRGTLGLVSRGLEGYSRSPWLLLALVDGVAASLVQGLPLPDDEVMVATMARAVRAAEPPSPTDHPRTASP
jgi:AcrR family transcriptional regulator